MCQACPEALCEGLDPVVSKHHSLRQTEMELLLWAQNHTTGPCSWEELLQQLSELLLRMVWGGNEWHKERCTQEIQSSAGLNKWSQFVLVQHTEGGRDICWWWITTNKLGRSYMANKHKWPSCLSHVWRSERVHHEDRCLQSVTPLPLETWPTGNQEEAACWKQPSITSLHVMFPISVKRWIVWKLMSNTYPKTVLIFIIQGNGRGHLINYI